MKTGLPSTRRLAALALLLIVNLASGPAAAADAAATAKRVFTMSGFQQISLEGPYSLHVRVGRGVSVRAEGDRDALDAAYVAVQGDRLVIRQNRSGWSARDTDGPISFEVSVPALTAVRVAGSGSMTVDGVKASRFTGTLLGTGRLAISGATVDMATISASGSGSISIAGTAGAARLAVQGASDIDASAFAVRTLDAAMQGAGTIKAQASESARVVLAGAGDVEIAGDARCSVTRSGSGRVTCGR